MEVIRFDQEEDAVRMFLELPSMLYSKQEIMQNKSDEEKLLRGTHYLNRYVALSKFLVTDKGRPLARCVVTEYHGDPIASFGFFECIEDFSVFRLLMNAVERHVTELQYTGLEGPLDVSLWIRYRFKSNLFDLPPYTGEPYNKPYYPEFFQKAGYQIKERYVSNRYRTLPRKDFELPAYQKRWETFTAKGYEIRSPKKEEWDLRIGEVYDMIAVLYRNFLTYHEITREEFIADYNSYRQIVDFDLIKIAYYKGKAIGFFMGIPNYGNLASLPRTPGSLLRFFRLKIRPKEYVLLYMGVMPEHRGIGMALTHSIMAELAKKQVPSIGALIRQGNPNYDYAKEYMTGRYEYVYLDKKFTIQEYLRRALEKWEKDDYIWERISDGWKSRTFGDFVRDVRKCAHWLLESGFCGRSIGIYGGNSYWWMVLDVSVMGHVGISFPIDAQYRLEELRNILSASELSLLVYSDDKEDIVRIIKTEFPQIRFCTMDSLSEQFTGCSETDDFTDIDPQKTVKVLYTSGTSARPKGVMLSQANMFSNWRTLYDRTPMTHEDSIYLVLPLNHVYAGVAAFLYTLVSGMRIYLGSFAPDVCLADFKALSPSVFICVPLLADRLWTLAAGAESGSGTVPGLGTETESGTGSMDIPNAFGGRMKYFYCGGTAIDPQLKKNYIAAGIPFIEAYGLSETSSVVALDVVGNYRDGSAGIVMENLEAFIHDPDENGVGELYIRSGSVMNGYYKMPKETEAVLDSDGFFHTGDLASLDEDRRLFLTGRKRPMLLTSNGKNVYPQEVEDLVCRHPLIHRATLYVDQDRLYLKVWYTGDESLVRRWLLEAREQLPKYMHYQEFECILDTLGGRIK